MPKKHLSARISESAFTNFENYMKTHSLDKTEALEQILRNLLSPLSESASPGASDLLPCKQRIGTDPNMACLNPPTLYRKVIITEINPEICRACQVLSKNLPEKYEVKETPAQETFDRPREPCSDPSNSTRKNAGMVWCPEGLWVFPLKCEKCRERSYAVWFDCQKQRYKRLAQDKQAPSDDARRAVKGADEDDVKNGLLAKANNGENMTEACFLARGAQPLRKPTTCEECFCVSTCKMFKNFKELEQKCKSTANLPS
jgi:hypothetical protein